MHDGPRTHLQLIDTGDDMKKLDKCPSQHIQANMLRTQLVYLLTTYMIRWQHRHASCSKVYYMRVPVDEEAHTEFQKDTGLYVSR